MNDTTAKKLLKALKLFIPSSASLALKEDDAQRFFDIANMSGLTIVHGDSEPKTKYELPSAIYKAVTELCKQRVSDFAKDYYISFKIEINEKEPKLDIRIWKNGNSWRDHTDIFKYEGKVSLDRVIYDLEEQLKGIETLVVIESPVEEVENPKTEE